MSDTYGRHEWPEDAGGGTVRTHLGLVYRTFVRVGEVGGNVIWRPIAHHPGRGAHRYDELAYRYQRGDIDRLVTTTRPSGFERLDGAA